MATKSAVRELHCITPVIRPATLPNGSQSFRIRTAGKRDDNPCTARTQRKKKKALRAQLPKWTRILLASIIALAACMISAKAAMIERGYPAIGGEVFFSAMVGVAAYTALGFGRHKKAPRC